MFYSDKFGRLVVVARELHGQGRRVRDALTLSIYARRAGGTRLSVEARKWIWCIWKGCNAAVWLTIRQW